MYFEAVITGTIILAGVLIGYELDNEGKLTASQELTLKSINTACVVIFTLEAVLKLMAEGFRPWNYFLSAADGTYNTIDFVIIVLTLVALGINADGTVVQTVRMIRLFRLLNLAKNVQQLRVIVRGLSDGMRSVGPVLMLLFLVLYIYAIAGTAFFSKNMPSHFGKSTTARAEAPHTPSPRFPAKPPFPCGVVPSCLAFFPGPSSLE